MCTRGSIKTDPTDFPMPSAPPHPTSFHWPRVTALVRQTARKWKTDNIPRLSAALSYYAIFTLSPLVILMLTLGGAWFGTEQARSELDMHLHTVLGTTAADAVGDLVTAPPPFHLSSPTAIGSLVFLLFGATRLFGELKQSLNQIWEIKQPRRRALHACVRKLIMNMSTTLNIRERKRERGGGA